MKILMGVNVLNILYNFKGNSPLKYSLIFNICTFYLGNGSVRTPGPNKEKTSKAVKRFIIGIWKGFLLRVFLIKPNFPHFLISWYLKIPGDKKCVTSQKNLSVRLHRYFSDDSRHVWMISCVGVHAQEYLTLGNPLYGSPPGSSVHRILQERILEWENEMISLDYFLKFYSLVPKSLRVENQMWFALKSVCINTSLQTPFKGEPCCVISSVPLW